MKTAKPRHSISKHGHFITVERLYFLILVGILWVIWKSSWNTDNISNHNNEVTLAMERLDRDLQSTKFKFSRLQSIAEQQNVSFNISGYSSAMKSLRSMSDSLRSIEGRMKPLKQNHGFFPGSRPLSSSRKPMSGYVSHEPIPSAIFVTNKYPKDMQLYEIAQAEMKVKGRYSSYKHDFIVVRTVGSVFVYNHSNADSCLVS